LAQTSVLNRYGRPFDCLILASPAAQVGDMFCFLPGNPTGAYVLLRPSESKISKADEQSIRSLFEGDDEVQVQVPVPEFGFLQVQSYSFVGQCYCEEPKLGELLVGSGVRHFPSFSPRCESRPGPKPGAVVIFAII